MKCYVLVNDFILCQKSHRRNKIIVRNILTCALSQSRINDLDQIYGYHWDVLVSYDHLNCMQICFHRRVIVFLGQETVSA